MPKKVCNLISFLFYIFSATVVFAQERQLPGNNTQPNDYLTYYRTVALAEEAIVNGKHENALKYYKDIFKEYTFNNPVDCYIAGQVASYLGDTLACANFIYAGISFGLPIQTVTTNPHLVNILGTLEQTTIDSCWSLYKKRINMNARSIMLSLIKRDQVVVKGLLRGESLYESDGYTLKELYKPLWDSLVKEVISITLKYGFPAQKIIGTQNGDDSIFNIGPNSVFVTYIFIHHGNAWNQINEILWPELLKGNITPQMYGVIYESSNVHRAYDKEPVYIASRPCSDKPCTDFLKKNIKKINSRRWEIGLGSYEVMQKKFESRANYYKWCRKKVRTRKPFFDFQCDLSFQGL